MSGTTDRPAARVSPADHDAAVRLTTAWLHADKKVLQDQLAGASRLALRHAAQLTAFAIREANGAGAACVGCWWKHWLAGVEAHQPPDDERTER